jgi:hypothetical protein
MASIESNRAAGKAAIEAGTLVPAKPPSEPSSSPSLPLNPYPATPNPYQLCPLPAISVQQPDQQRQFQSGAVPQTRLIPVPATSNPQIAAQSASVIQVIKTTTAGSGLLLQTNNQTNPSQSVLNLVQGTNISLSSNAQGQVTIGNTASAGSIPTKSNIGLFPSSRLFTGNGTLSAGNTINWIVPAESVVNQATKFTIALAPQGFGHANASLDIANIVMKRTLRSSLSVVDTTPVTFGGLTALTITGETTSDQISLVIDALHDYYLMIYISGAASNLHTGFADFSAVPAGATPQQLGDTVGSDGTGATTIPSLTLDNSFFRLWTRFLTV